MASLRHGQAVRMEGWMEKPKAFGFMRKKPARRYMYLKESVLSCHHDQNSPAKWEVNVSNCPVLTGSGKLELKVELPHRKIALYALDEQSFQAWKTALRSASSRIVEDFYDIGDLIGRGACAEVRECRDRKTKEKFAIKIMRKNFSPSEMEWLLREVNIMKSVQHPSIITTYDVFDTKEKIYIVLEMMGGGELFDIIADCTFFSEERSKMLMRDIVSGVAYLHAHSIVHRDLKPENVLCKSKEWPYGVKIADFGLANYIQEWEDSKRPKTVVGTIGYIAPEVVRKERFGSAVDMWSCGVILFIMLSGKMPFYGETDEECLQKISDGEFQFQEDEWEHISSEAKSLVRSLLQVEPNKRLTARACLHHPWLEMWPPAQSGPGGGDRTESDTREKTKRFRAAAFTALAAVNFLSLVEDKLVEGGQDLAPSNYGNYVIRFQDDEDDLEFEKLEIENDILEQPEDQKEDQTEEEARMEAEIVAEIEAEIDAEIEAEIDAEVDAEIDAEIEAEIDAEVDAEVDAEIDAQIEDDVESLLGEDFDAQLEEEIEREIEAELEAELEAEHDAEIEEVVVYEEVEIEEVESEMEKEFEQLVEDANEVDDLLSQPLVDAVDQAELDEELQFEEVDDEELEHL